MIDIKSGAPWETITLTTLQKYRDAVGELLNDARHEAVKLEEGKMVVYNSYGPEWRPFGPPRKRRPFGSVILAQGLAEEILGDVKSFLGNEQWYRDRGMRDLRPALLRLTLSRNTLSQGVSAARLARNRKNELHHRSGERAQVQYMCY